MNKVRKGGIHPRNVDHCSAFQVRWVTLFQVWNVVGAGKWEIGDRWQGGYEDNQPAGKGINHIFTHPMHRTRVHNSVSTSQMISKKEMRKVVELLLNWQVVSGDSMKCTEVPGGCTEQRSVAPHWSLFKRLRHFVHHCCHSGKLKVSF